MVKMVFFILLSLAVLVGANIYVPYRIGKLLALKRKKILYAVFAFGAVSFPLSMWLQRSMVSGFTEIYTIFTATWAGVFFYLLMFLLGYEVIHLFLKKTRKATAVFIIIHALLIAAYAGWNARDFKVNGVEIPMDGIKGELRIIHISDLHIGPFRGRGYLEKIVAAANRENPHLVLITGDMADSNYVLNEETFGPLKKLTAPAYFTTGNHESYVDMEKELAILAASNVRVLRNAVVETHGIQLVGLDYMNADENTFDMHSVNKATIKETLPALDIGSDKPAILMHHSPVGLQYVSREGIDLMLTGHTHGGQMFPITLIGKLFFPYIKGLYHHGGTALYVSQGAGTYGPPMRLGTKNEITRVLLTGPAGDPVDSATQGGMQ